MADLITEKDVWNKAIQFLARREFSRSELAVKLSSADELLVAAVLDKLEEQGYLSDQRFTESFIRMRISQGHGLNRIRFDLKRKGIPSNLLSEVLEAMEIDWFELAAELYQRKYSSSIEKGDHKERNKRMRFMSQRGYLMDEIKHAISQFEQQDI